MTDVLKSPQWYHTKDTRILEVFQLEQKYHQKEVQGGFRECGQVCKLCTLSPPGVTKQHTCKHTGKSYKINSPLNCKTSGVAYRITCNKCPDFVYIVETGRHLKQRFSKHQPDAANKDITKPCGKYFSLPGHSEINMCAIAIEQVLPKQDTLLGKRRESLWINLYQSVEGPSINYVV